MTFYNLDKDQVDHLLSDLGYKLPDDYLAKNLDYYLARTSHGSTLSRVVHAQLALMAGNEDLSWKLYSDALASDYNDIQGGTTAEGIHAGVMAGTILIAITAYAGIDLRQEMLQINPKLPRQWKSMKFNFNFKNVHYQMTITTDKVNILADRNSAIVIFGKWQEVISGQSAEFENKPN
jgi:trehalose/maltose hydrolase-like predicted phosphorylase